MENTLIFQHIAHHQWVCQEPGAYSASIEEALQDIKQYSLLQFSFIATEVIYAFKHFGLCCLGPLGRHMLSENLGKLSGIDSQFLGTCLETAAYDIMAKHKILGLCDESMDWEELNKEFSIEWTKRAFITATSNDYDFGLSSFDATEVQKARQEAQSVLNDLSHGPDREGGQYLSFLVPLAQLIKADPLAVLAWRVEAMSQFGATIDDPCAHPLEDVKNTYKKARALSGFMSILMSLSHPKLAKDQYLQTPCLIKDLEKRILNPKKGVQWDKALIFQWLETTSATLLADLNSLKNQALKNKLVFEIKGEKIGLTTLGLQMLKPHRSAILEQLIQYKQIF